MTTTLRPVGPTEHGADGTRRRAFHVRVHGRPVGSVRLATEVPLAGEEPLATAEPLAREQRAGVPAVGRIAELRIAPPDRRRGRATVAALAAEEILRDWGCGSVVATVGEARAGARALAAALGYTECLRTLARGLPEAPLAPGAARPMTAAEYPAWRAAERDRRARALVRRSVPSEEAAARAEAALVRLLPDGPQTPGVALLVREHAGTAVGAVCVATGAGPWSPDPDAADGPEGRAAWDGRVLALDVAEEHRRRGHGRALLAAAEERCRSAGGRRLALRVAPENAPAGALCAALGYAVVQRHFAKPL